MVFPNSAQHLAIRRLKAWCIAFVGRIFKLRIMKKRKLNTIAKRIAKTILMQVEISLMLDDTQLTEDETGYVDDCIKRIAERITEDEQESDIERLVNEVLTK
jgi:hypothetical protein